MREGIFRFRPDGEYYFEEGCFVLELCNSAEDPEVSIARARVQVGVTTRLHRLEGVTERYVILEGEGRVEVGTLPSQTVHPGDIVFIPAGSPQRSAIAGQRSPITSWDSTIRGRTAGSMPKRAQSPGSQAPA